LINLIFLNTSKKKTKKKLLRSKKTITQASKKKYLDAHLLKQHKCATSKKIKKIKKTNQQT